MNRKFVSLVENFVIRGSESEQVLLNLKTGVCYTLVREQFDFLAQFTGEYTLEEILSQYDQESQQVARDFLANLRAVGALLFSGINKVHRKLPEGVVPDVRLEAVHLENSSRCNLHCEHCYQGKRYPIANNLTFAELEKVADSMKEMQVQGISVSGGEPFCQEDIFDIVRLFEKREIRIISFFTNGVLLTEALVQNILRLRSQPVVFVSLDAITPEGMAFRGLNNSEGGVALKKVLASIAMLRANNVRVVVNTVINACNVDLLINMHDVIKRLDVSSWRLGYPKKTGYYEKSKEQFNLSWDTVANASFDLLKHHFRLGKPFHMQIEYLYREELFRDFQPLPDDAFVCDYEDKRQSCCLKPNGDIVSCAYCMDFPLGNIRYQSLWDVWYSKQMRSFKEIRIGDVRECQDCEYRSYCATGCRINAYFLNSDFYHSKDDYACQAVKFFVDTVMPCLIKEGEII